MVNAYHVIFTTYGFWLPNDPRGSWSDFVRSWELYQYGAATKVMTRRSLASAPHDRQLRRDQKSVLKYDPVRFSEEQIQSVARGFGRAVWESGYELLACSIMPEHVHAVPLRHRNTAEQIMSHFKARDAATPRGWIASTRAVSRGGNTRSLRVGTSGMESVSQFG